MQNTPQIPQPVEFLYSKQYKEVTIVDEKQYFGKIMKGLELLPIDDKFYKTIQTLIRFFKFSFLILLKQPVQKILDDPQLLASHQTDLKKIAKMAQDMIGPGGHIYELDFLFQKGVDHTFYKKLQIKEEKRKFIEYIKNLSQHKKRLYDLIKDKMITQDDILQFQSYNFDKELKHLDEYLENYIKLCTKDIEQKYQAIKKEKKILAKKAQQQQQILQKQNELQSSTKKKPEQANKQDQNLEDIMVCCRRSFYHKQVIYQPESMHVVYRQYYDYLKRENYFDILKTICGLLNSQGGFLFIGIREDKNTYKKEVEGYTIIEKDKVEFKNRIEQLVDKCILPTISHDILKVQFVPLKSQQSNKFISGKFLIKICVRFGERKEFYSFKEHPDAKKEYFAVRTDNDTKIIASAQDILNIYKNRLLETPPDPLPIHKDPCPKPEVGRPLYELEEFSKK